MLLKMILLDQLTASIQEGALPLIDKKIESLEKRARESTHG